VGIGAGGGAVVRAGVLAVQGAKVPGQGGMDAVVAVPVAGQQADVDRPVQQGDAGVSGESVQGGHGVGLDDPGIAHEAHDVHVDDVPEQMQHRENRPLLVGEGVAESVVQ
jgi:hypothetical protein